jgi:hypothetical protein
VKITFTVTGGTRLYAALFPLAGAATVLCANDAIPSREPNFSGGAALFAAGLFYGHLLHNRPRPRH